MGEKQLLLCPMPGLRVEIGRNKTAWQGKRKYQAASQERPKGGERNIKIKLSHENIQNSGGKEKKKKRSTDKSKTTRN